MKRGGGGGTVNCINELELGLHKVKRLIEIQLLVELFLIR